jgi:hypothetical protein
LVSRLARVSGRATSAGSDPAFWLDLPQRPVRARGPTAEAALDTARINDLDQQIDALQRQLKALQRGNIRSGSPIFSI